MTKEYIPWSKLEETLASAKSPRYGVIDGDAVVKIDHDGTETRGRFDADGNFVADRVTHKDRLAELEQRVAQLTSERDEWAAKWQRMSRKYAELRWPGLTRIITGKDAAGAGEVQHG